MLEFKAENITSEQVRELIKSFKIGDSFMIKHSDQMLNKTNLVQKIAREEFGFIVSSERFFKVNSAGKPVKYLGRRLWRSK